MKYPSLTKAVLGTWIACTLFTLDAATPKTPSEQELKSWYEYAYMTPSDINQHLPHLKQLAKECSSVAEIGVRSMVSTWGVLYGLAQSATAKRTYLGIDLSMPPVGPYSAAKRLAESNNIEFHFLQANDMTIDLEPVDMLFIDSLHTYCHLTYELETFAPQVNKYIALHDTSYPWGEYDENCYDGDYSEYPEQINREKRGLWAAVEDFLENHPEWSLQERHLNNHGFTILKRIHSN